MATERHTTTKADGSSPGRIEMERLRDQADRLAEYHSVYTDIEGPILDAICMADLVMTWWNYTAQERADFSKHIGGPFTLNERDRLITSFALGDIWDRLRKIDERMNQVNQETAEVA